MRCKRCRVQIRLWLLDCVQPSNNFEFENILVINFLEALGEITEDSVRALVLAKCFEHYINEIIRKRVVMKYFSLLLFFEEK